MFRTGSLQTVRLTLDEWRILAAQMATTAVDHENRNVAKRLIYIGKLIDRDIFGEVGGDEDKDKHLLDKDEHQDEGL